MEKIQVFNTLVFSLFGYSMKVLHACPISFVKRFEVMRKGFIWNQGTAKIPTHILTANEVDGGLGLVNFESRDTSSKIDWIFQLAANVKMHTLAYELMSNLLHDRIWEICLNSKEVSALFPQHSFWVDVLQGWLKYKEFRGISVEPENQIIWYNSNIRIANSPVVWRHWIQQGILWVKDLISNKQWISFEAWVNRSSKISRLEYNGILSAIKVAFPNVVETEGEDTSHVSLYSFYSNLDKPGKLIYYSWNTKEDLLMFHFMHFRNAWQIQGDYSKYEDYLKAVLNITKLTISAKLHSFQYKLLLSAILTNVRLAYIKIKPNGLCDFCGLQTETYSHLFLNCIVIRRMWDSLLQKFKLNAADYQIILNNVHPNPNHCDNSIILYAKFYIYKTKCASERLSFNNLLSYISEWVRVEKQIANNKDKLSQHTIKWENYDTISQQS